MRRLTHDEFLAKSRAVWGERWDYSQTAYRRMAEKITLVCREHGTFSQGPQAHLKGLVGCSGCNGQQPLTNEDFKHRVEAKHGKGKFDFSEVALHRGGIHQQVTLTCFTHDISFTSSAWSIIRGRTGCWKCYPQSKMNPEKLEWKASLVYPGRSYDYSQVDFSIDVREKTTIGCHVKGHGFFSQSIDGHLSGRDGCSICARQSSLMTVDEFVTRSKAVWGETHYDYSEVTLPDGAKGSDLVLRCQLHGVFTYKVNPHLLGNEGCLECRSKFGPSRGEQEFGDYVESLGLTIERNNRIVLGGKEIDVYVPSLGIGFEYNGLYYHSEKFTSPTAHYEKWKLAQAKGVRLYQIWEDDWKARRAVVESHVAHVAGMSKATRVFARSCTVKEISAVMAKPFLEENHIQGFVPSSVYLGLFEANELVSVALFLKDKKNYTLTRYATNKVVIGGHSKLVSHFEKTYTYEKLVTFADLSFSDGNLYRKTGWTEDAILQPDYSYIRGAQRVHKFSFRKSRFKSDPELIFAEGLTELELAKLNNLVRIWDAGKIRFTKDRVDLPRA